jgi:hypothetical protein
LIPVNSVMKDALPLAPAPELVFGLVGPIGVDLELVTTILTEALQDQRYAVEPLRITTLMREVPIDITIQENPYIDSMRSRISYANKVRELLERNNAMAILAISAIANCGPGAAMSRRRPWPTKRTSSASSSDQRRSSYSEAFTVGSSFKFPRTPRSSTGLRGLLTRRGLLGVD